MKYGLLLYIQKKEKYGISIQTFKIMM